MYENKQNILNKLGLIILFIVLFFLSFILIFKITTRIPILDDGNLLIHEAGHLIFSPFGNFMSFLGGTIAQIAIPILFLIYFLIKSDNYGTSFSIFWIGENIINVAYYISDAQTQALYLVGGGIHDWNTILSSLGILRFATTLGNITFILGIIILLFSLISVYLFNFLKNAKN